MTIVKFTLTSCDQCLFAQLCAGSANSHVQAFCDIFSLLYITHMLREKFLYGMDIYVFFTF